MRNLFIVIIVLLMAFPANAKQVPDWQVPDWIEKIVPQAAPVGSGRMTYMIFDVYDATLYAPGGKLRTNKPYALQLDYLRNLKGRAIADRSIEEIRKQGYKDEIKLAAWHDQMRRIFPDVTPTTSLTGVYTPAVTIFYKNGQKIGVIPDPEFGRYFFNIWLGPATSAPELRRRLIGQTN